MKKKLALALALVMTMSVALTACGGGGKLTFTTGGDQGTYYGFGTVLAGQISDKTPSWALSSPTLWLTPTTASACLKRR